MFNKFAVVLSVLGFVCAAKQSRYIALDSCVCNLLHCVCCTGASLPFNSQEHLVCIDANGIPNELTLTMTLMVDGNNIYTQKLDASIAAVCPPEVPGVCWAVNHVNLSEHEICTKLTALSSLTLVKFPCIRITEDGKLVARKNVFN